LRTRYDLFAALRSVYEGSGSRRMTQTRVPFYKQAWLLALAYLACIPIFALLYQLLCPGGFYAPYARYERDRVGFQRAASTAVDGAVQRSESLGISPKQHLGLVSPRGFPLTDPPSKDLLDHSTIEVRDVDSDGDGIKFELNATYYLPISRTSALRNSRFDDPNSALLVEVRLPLRAFVDASQASDDVDRKHIVTPCMDRNKTIMIGEKPLLYGAGMGSEKLFVRPQRQLTPAENAMYRSYFPTEASPNSVETTALCATKAEVQAIDAFANFQTGLSLPISQSLPRMAYLSVVVITTLGLGDIVPITDLARLLVGLEAVTGIFIAGLFVNAVTTQSRQS
jgi:hypothetical protein